MLFVVPEPDTIRRTCFARVLCFFVVYNCAKHFETFKAETALLRVSKTRRHLYLETIASLVFVYDTNRKWKQLAYCVCFKSLSYPHKTKSLVFNNRLWKELAKREAKKSL